MEDHVHLLAALSSTVSMSQLMKQIKEISSRMVSEAIRPGSWFAWQANYPAFAVSPSHMKRVIRYVDNQKQHHAASSLWPEAEETDESALLEDP